MSEVTQLFPEAQAGWRNPLVEGAALIVRHCIDETAELGEQTHITLAADGSGRFTEIGPNAQIGDRVRIGELTQIGAGVVIADDVQIDRNNVIFEDCVLGEGTSLGPDNIIGFGNQLHDTKIDTKNRIRSENEFEATQISSYNNIGQRNVFDGARMFNHNRVGDDNYVLPGVDLCSYSKINDGNVVIARGTKVKKVRPSVK